MKIPVGVFKQVAELVNRTYANVYYINEETQPLHICGNRIACLFSDLFVICDLPVKLCDKEIVVSAKLFARAIPTLVGPDVTVRFNRKALVLDSGKGSRIELAFLETETSSMTEVVVPTKWILVKQADSLLDQLQVISATAAIERGTGVLAGLHFAKSSIFTTDRIRVASIKTEMVAEVPVTVVKHFVQVVGYALHREDLLTGVVGTDEKGVAKEPGKLEYQFTDKGLLFRVNDNLVLSAPYIVGDFPDCQGILRKSWKAVKDNHFDLPETFAEAVRGHAAIQKAYADFYDREIEIVSSKSKLTITTTGSGVSRFDTFKFTGPTVSLFLNPCTLFDSYYGDSASDSDFAGGIYVQPDGQVVMFKSARHMLAIRCRTPVKDDAADL